jgi:hypothetical protein
MSIYFLASNKWWLSWMLTNTLKHNTLGRQHQGWNGTIPLQSSGKCCTSTPPRAISIVCSCPKSSPYSNWSSLQISLCVGQTMGWIENKEAHGHLKKYVLHVINLINQAAHEQKFPEEEHLHQLVSKVVFYCMEPSIGGAPACLMLSKSVSTVLSLMYPNAICEVSDSYSYDFVYLVIVVCHTKISSWFYTGRD